MESNEICPVAEAATILGDKWTIILLRDLADGPRRFKDLERSAEGISPSMLVTRLKALEVGRLVSRTSFNEVPPRVEYELTTKGQDTLPVIEALRSYGRRWLLPEAAGAR